MEMYGVTGEKLGYFSDELDQDTLPDWKKSLLSTPSISVRKGIAWGFNPPSEDTDTLVLTSNSHKFIDIRFPTEYDQHISINNNQSFWAFTGVSKTTFPGFTPHMRKDGKMDGFDWEWPHLAHTVWSHEMDSKGPGVKDEGDVMVLKNGDCIELGIMKDAETGEPKLYKEYWSEPPLRQKEATVRKSPCVVAEMIESSGEVKQARVIRIGDYCQGVAEVEKGDGVGVLAARYIKSPQRGFWQGTADNIGRGWTMDARSGLTSVSDGRKPFFSELIPCSWVCDDRRRLGDELEMLSTTWKILELDRGPRAQPGCSVGFENDQLTLNEATAVFNQHVKAQEKFGNRSMSLSSGSLSDSGRRDAD